MRCWLAVLLLCSGVAFAATPDEIDVRIAAFLKASEPPGSWDPVEAVVEAAARVDADSVAGRYAGTFRELHLAPDGRAAAVLRADAVDANVVDDEDLVVDTASLGHWRQDGDWVELYYEDYRSRPTETIPPARVKLMREIIAAEYPGMDLGDAVIEFASRMATAMDEAEPESTASTDEAVAREPDERMLRIETPDGIVMLGEDVLLWQAQRWPGEGPLELSASYWRSANADADSGERDVPRRFELPDPLHAAVPQALRALLRPDIIETTVIGRDDTDLTWNRHRAEVTLRLDRGSRDGLIEGMSLYGVEPHRGVFAEVKQVGERESLATVQVTRFAAEDVPALPEKGMVLASRLASSLACGIDDSAAVRARITAVRAPATGAARDAEGFVYAQLDIDQGASHGLAMDDTFSIEGDGGERGEGRVRVLGPQTATVLWRIDPPWFLPEAGEAPAEAAVPVVGEYVVTPAWEWTERELFGSGDSAAR